ncbi:uncharacterized protein ACNS7B_014100 [Menidia menidia]
MAEGYATQRGDIPPSCSPLSPHCGTSTQIWLPFESPLRPPWNDGFTEQDEVPGDCHGHEQSGRSPSSRFYEELFCTGQISIPLGSLTCALMASSGPQSDVVKQGYLGKLERNHRRYFVLRAGSHTGPSRLEWYKSQEKFTAMEKSVGKTTLFGLNKQGVIYLRCCLGVSRVGSSRKGHMLALYDKDQTMLLVMEDQQQQEDWYAAVKKLMEEEQKDDEHVEGVDEEDDGYCTLPPAAFFKEVWSVKVKPRGLGSSKPLTGESRLCLTATSLVLVRLGTSNDLPSVTIPLLSVRRFGHLDGLFFLELGRSAPNGPGEIWMEAREQGNPALAQHIHEAVRETVRALRAFPDFSSSPTSGQSQPPALLASKRCRPKYRSRPGNMRTLTPVVLHPRSSDNQAGPVEIDQKPETSDQTKSESCLSLTSHSSPSRTLQSSVPDTGSYVETRRDLCKAAVWKMKSWESSEVEEGIGYMIMSPQISNSSSELAQDDYVTMESPQKPNHPAFSSSSSFSSLQTTFSSSTCDGYSPLHPSRRHTEDSRPHWLTVQPSETGADQSDVSTSCSSLPQGDEQQEQKSEQHNQQSPQTAPNGDMPTLTIPFVLSGSGCTRLPQSSPNFDTSQSSRPQTTSDRSADRRYWLSACLLSCLHAEDGS